MDALATRGYVAASGDYYLCPLSHKQVKVEELSRLIERALSGAQELTKVFARRGQKRELIAEGYHYLEAVETIVEGAAVSWDEQRVVVRSVGFAKQQATNLDQRVKQAVAQLSKFNERKQGKKRLTETELKAAVERIVEQEKVGGLVAVEIETRRSERPVRKCQERAARTVVEEESRVLIKVDKEAVKVAKQRLGWRVYASNHSMEAWSIEQVVTSYREQYLIERGFARLKGKSLSLQPHYLQREERVAGLLNLLVIGLRLLSLMEHEVRKSLSLKEEAEERELKGLYVGQQQKATSRPTSEMMLKAFKGISLVHQEMSGEIRAWVTPLTDLQKRILQLLNFSKEIYEKLASSFSEPNFILSET
jgi:transposase